MLGKLQVRGPNHDERQGLPFSIIIQTFAEVVLIHNQLCLSCTNVFTNKISCASGEEIRYLLRWTTRELPVVVMGSSACHSALDHLGVFWTSAPVIGGLREQE